MIARRIRRIVATLVCFATASSSAISASVIDDSFPSNAKLQFDEMHRLVSADFLDPSSAQYKGIVLLPSGYLCGWVNARNSMGGYTPFYPFYIQLEKRDVNVGHNVYDATLGKLARMSFEFTGCDRALKM